MTNIYHVTSKKKIERIAENGILYEPTRNLTIDKRDNLRERIDTIANREFDDWINRREAVFFWTTLEDARTYSRVISGTPVVFVIESDNFELFCVDNQEVEFLFEQYIDNQIAGKLDEKIEEMLRYAQKWNGRKRKRQEIWTQPPVSSQEIVDVVDSNGRSIDVS